MRLSTCSSCRISCQKSALFRCCPEFGLVADVDEVRQNWYMLDNNHIHVCQTYQRRTIPRR